MSTNLRDIPIFRPLSCPADACPGVVCLDASPTVIAPRQTSEAHGEDADQLGALKPTHLAQILIGVLAALGREKGLAQTAPLSKAGHFLAELEAELYPWAATGTAPQIGEGD